MRRRSVLVTGAGGFVGASLTAGFAKLGLDVVAVDRAFDDEAPDEGPESAGSRIERVVGEIDDGLVGLLPPVDLIVHAAWITTGPDALGVRREEYVARNVAPLRALLPWARETKPAALLFLSSSGVFAPDDAGAPRAVTPLEAAGRTPAGVGAAPIEIDRVTMHVGRALTDTDEPTSSAPYAVAKRRGEALVLQEAHHLPAAFVVRLGYLFGPGERTRPTRTRRSLVAEWITAATRGRPLEVRSDDPVRDWTFTEDLAPALLRLVDGTPVQGPVHVASPYAYRDSEVAREIARRIPGARSVAVPGEGVVKPPMAPSHLPALEALPWTDLPSALDRMIGAGAPA